MFLDLFLDCKLAFDRWKTSEEKSVNAGVEAAGEDTTKKKENKIE